MIARTDRVKREGFVCTRDGLKIVGNRYFIPSEADLPIVIISHGFMANQRTTAGYAKQFARWGFMAFTFDFNGGCVHGRSEGKSTDMSVLTECRDLEAVIDYARSVPGTNEHSVSLMGCSQGGAVSAIVAARKKEQIKRLILFYPALCIPDDARRGSMMAARFDPADIPETFSCGPMKLGRIYAADVVGMNIYEEIAGYPGPVLIVQGDADKIVNLSYARTAYATYQKGQAVPASEKARPNRSDVCLRIIPGAGHGFSGSDDTKAVEAVRRFLLHKVEVLTVDVELTGKIVTNDGDHVTLPFTGEARSPYFEGTIEKGASDEQERKDYKMVSARAEYRINGKDFTGQECFVKVINVNDGSKWTPKVTTNSDALSFLNGAELEAVLEQRKKGPIVRIYADARKVPAF